MKKPSFGVAILTFAGGKGAHHDCPLYEKLDWNLTKDFALACEELGYDSLWVCDHLMMGKNNEIFEGWTTLTSLACLTKKIKVGSWVICNSYRNPALMAKMASTLDFISEGRLIFGYGAGWYEKEYMAYGYDFPKPKERIEQMKEGLKVILSLWKEKEVSYNGKYYKLKGAICEPKPLQKPRPKIMIGAWKPLMLKAVAELADIWDMGGDPSVEEYRRKMNILQDWCEKINRDFNSIEKSWDGHVLIGRNKGDFEDKISRIRREWGEYGAIEGYAYGKMQKMISGTPDECIEKINGLLDIGISRFILIFLDYPSTDGIKVFAERVMPNFV
ncbi:MAG: LLM class flavin-dependent oxidoreductase [Nitrososphaerales archaeon]